MIQVSRCFVIAFPWSSVAIEQLGRGADLVVAETESEANIIRGTALDAIFELQVNQAMAGAWRVCLKTGAYPQIAIVSIDFNGENDDESW